MNLFNKIKNYLTPKKNHNLEIIKIRFSYISSNEMTFTIFLSEKTTNLFETPIIDQKNLNQFLNKIKEINKITEININPIFKINDRPLIKIIRIKINYG